MTDLYTKKHMVRPHDAALICGWFKTRGGIIVWMSADMAEAGRTLTTPRLDTNGQEYGSPDAAAGVVKRPHWKCGDTFRIIKRISEVEVVMGEQVKRFHIGVRRGDNGLSIKLTDGATRNVKRHMAAAEKLHGPDCWYEFDYFSQDCVICKPGARVPLEEFVASPSLHPLEAT